MTLKLTRTPLGYGVVGVLPGGPPHKVRLDDGSVGWLNEWNIEWTTPLRDRVLNAFNRKPNWYTWELLAYIGCDVCQVVYNLVSEEKLVQHPVNHVLSLPEVKCTE